MVLEGSTEILWREWLHLRVARRDTVYLLRHRWGTLLGHGAWRVRAWSSMVETKVEKSKVTENGVAAGSHLTPLPPRPVWKTEEKGCYIFRAYKDRRETKFAGEAAIPSQFLKVSGRQPSGDVRRPVRAGYIGLHT